MPIQPVVAFQHRLTVAGQVVYDTDTRCDNVPRVKVGLRKRLGLDGDGAYGLPQLNLLRKPSLVTIPANAAVDRQTPHGPGVVRERADRIERVAGRQMAFVIVLEPADLRGRRNTEDQLAGNVIVVDVLDVTANALQEPNPLQLLEELAADFHGMAALRCVQEVGCGARPLLTVAIVLVLLMRAKDVELAYIAEEIVFRSVGNLRKVVAEITVARLDVQLLAQRAVPLRFVHPAARVLPVRRPWGEVLVIGERNPVRLNLLAPLVIPDDLVVLVGLVGALADRVPERGVEALAEEEIRLPDGVELLAVGAEPPDFVSLYRTADVDGRVVIPIDLVAVLTNRAVVERGWYCVLRQGCSIPAVSCCTNRRSTHR